MKNSVIVDYPTGSTNQLEVKYTIELNKNIQTVNCEVEEGHFPVWLQLRKFSILSVKESGSYTTLFNEINNSKNLDTCLFIDLVYSSIMKRKHCKLTHFL
jgi:hypothetical protein